MGVCIYACMHACMHVGMHAYAHACLYVNMYIHTLLHTCKVPDLLLAILHHVEDATLSFLKRHMIPTRPRLKYLNRRFALTGRQLSAELNKSFRCLGACHAHGLLRIVI